MEIRANDLAAAPRACAAGLHPLEAGTELLISNGTFLHRSDFTNRFIETGTSISDGAELPVACAAAPPRTMSMTPTPITIMVTMAGRNVRRTNRPKRRLSAAKLAENRSPMSMGLGRSAGVGASMSRA